MKNKRGLTTLMLIIILILLAILIVVLLVLGYLAYSFYSKDADTSTRGGSVNAWYAGEDECADIEDNYVQPDFGRTKEILSREEIVNDVPAKGKIKIMFYHFVGNCRIWDKIYFLSDGKIEERNADSDIDIWISSDYVDKIQEGNFCSVIAEARENGDLGQSANVGTTELLWTYKSMLEHKDCLGLKLT